MHNQPQVDLIGNTLSSDESRIIRIYSDLKDIVNDARLTPSAAANLKDALSAVGIAVTGLGLEYEHLIDHGC